MSLLRNVLNAPELRAAADVPDEAETGSTAIPPAVATARTEVHGAAMSARPAAVPPDTSPPAAQQDNRSQDNRSSYDVQSIDDLLAAAEAMSRPPAFGRAARRPAKDAVPANPPPTAAAARAGEPEEAIDAAVLDSLLARLDGPRGTLRDAIVTTYLDEGSTLVGRLVMAALDGNTEAVLLMVPGLRSTCAMLGAARLDGLLAQMQDSARSDSQQLATLAWAVDAEHTRVVAHLVVIQQQTSTSFG